MRYYVRFWLKKDLAESVEAIKRYIHIFVRGVIWEYLMKDLPNWVNFFFGRKCFQFFVERVPDERMRWTSAWVICKATFFIMYQRLLNILWSAQPIQLNLFLVESVHNPSLNESLTTRFVEKMHELLMKRCFYYFFNTYTWILWAAWPGKHCQMVRAQMESI